MKRKWKKLLAGVCAAAMGLTMFSTEKRDEINCHEIE